MRYYKMEGSHLLYKGELIGFIDLIEGEKDFFFVKLADSEYEETFVGKRSDAKKRLIELFKEKV